MFERGNQRRFVQHLPGMMRHGPPPQLDGSGVHSLIQTHHHPEILEKHLNVQDAEIQRLAGDNHRLAATHSSLREDLAAAQKEIQRMKAHTRSVQTESDIQLRVLMEKMAKMRADIQGGDAVKKELQQAHMEAHNLVAARQEMTTQIQRATLELQKVRSDVQNLPKMHAELDSLRDEHRRLRASFEYEKSLNMEEVEKMQGMEKKMLGMAREVEKLRAGVLNAEKQAHAMLPQFNTTYVNSDASYGRHYSPHVGPGGLGLPKQPYL